MRLIWYTFVRNASKVLGKFGLGHILDGMFLSIYKKCAAETDSVEIQSIVGAKPPEMQHDSKQVPTWCIEQYLSHRFDLLGSGWICMNRKTSSSCDATHEQYQAIDWQRDYKSDYCFDIAHSGRAIMRTPIPDGVDIKSPWELSRMYHLPKLALAAMSGSDQNILFLEYQNQVFDFITHNPVGFGVNWTCAMEVGIRAANILLAYDIFSAIMPMQKNVDFRKLIVRSMFEHGRFIFLNLEKARGGKANGNHYLSDLCGLMFISSYIVTEETLLWRKFAIKELLIEIDSQFFFDGGSIEGSTAYHRLCAELSAYSTALMLHCGVSIPPELQNKLYSIAKFMRIITKEDGDIIQIGDNDSGHLFRLTEAGTMLNPNIYCLQANERSVERAVSTFDIDELWAGRASDAIFALFGIDAKNNTEAFIVNALKGSNVILDKYGVLDQHCTEDTVKSVEFSHVKKQKYGFISSIDSSKLNHTVMRNFGLAVYSCSNFQLFVRLPVSNNRFLRSHIHDDIFHWECYHDGNVGFQDPGSYTYTSNKAERAQYRCNKAHNVPIHVEPFIKIKSIWDAEIRYEACTVTCEDRKIEMTVQAGNTVHKRTISIYDAEICIDDRSNHTFICNDSPVVPFSSGYGKRL